VIYTFYSFKGGVGRSMALANVAECFYLNGLRVVMLDWDLEAPGLESFFFEHGDNRPAAATGALEGIELVQSHLGLIDLLTEYRRSFSALAPALTMPAAEQWIPKSFRDRIAHELRESQSIAPTFSQQLDDHLSLATYLYEIHGANAQGRGGLWLLPAGWRHKERFEAYAQGVQAFDWEDFYISYRGKDFFDWLRSKLLELADVVLIDSRTGVTEMGGVCARQLADVVVSFCAPNHQNVDGVARMVKSFKRPETIEARDNRPLETLVVPTRVDPQEVKKLEEFLDRFNGAVNEQQDAPGIFREVGSRYWDLRIPYRTIYSYEERRVIGPGIKDLDPTQGLEKAYRKLTTHLALLAEEGSSIRKQFVSELQQEFPALVPKVALLSTPGGEEDFDKVTRFLEDSGIGFLREPPTTDLARWTSLMDQVVHVVIVTADQPRLDGLQDATQVTRRLGRWIHLVGPSTGWQPPNWLHGARTYSLASLPQILERLRTSRLTVRVPMMAPTPSSSHVARPALQQKLKELLLSASPKSRDCYALWGEGGTGKTTLAAVTVRDDEIVDAFPDGILWIQATDAGAMGHLLTALTGDTPPADGAASRVADVLRGARVLLVIDEAWNQNDIAPFMELGDRATRLILTRNLDLASTVAQQVISVGSMSPAEAAQLLAGLPAGAELAAKLGNWPLALTLARSNLDQQVAQQKNPADAIDALTEKVGRHGIIAFDVIGQAASAEVARNQSVAASVDATLARFAPWQRARLQQLAQVARDSTASFDAVAAKWENAPAESGEPRPFDRRERQRLLQLFSAFGLIDWNAKNESITLQPLYRSVLEAQGVIGEAPPPLARPHVSSGGDRQTNQDVEQIRRMLAGQEVAYPDAVQLFNRLKKARYFSYARQLLTRIQRMPAASDQRLYFAQQLALCTYKDTDLGVEARSKQALAILDEADPLAATVNQETLGLAGAVHKQRYRATAQNSDLERSATYYLRGYARGIAVDYGYTAINAAFILDLLAQHEERQAQQAGAAVSSDGQAPYLSSAKKRELAARIRQEIVDTLPGLARTPADAWLERQWWFLVTVAEAWFGLGRHDEARYWLREALGVEWVEWEFESTARQLAELAWAQNGGAPPKPDSPASATLRVFLANDAVAVESVTTGKVGLALSGGGFRASLFHIGTLARLAELDILRRLDAISCVSGGSIIGAHYYLEVRKLHETKRDEDITREDYIELVKRLERDFVAGVQRNLRTRLYANPWTSIKCLRPRYNRTDRLGELFESHLFSRVEPRKKWWLNELTIQPVGAPPGFSPKLDNWRRANKVPTLILNATTLNTGHNWQFTATWMGEPPAGAGSEVDTNDLLRRMYYWEAPPKYRAIRLGRAVAASACVPGLFEPVEMDRLFPARQVRLVDGGVHDNQGIAALLEQECAVLLVSDASGQMESQNNPGAGRFTALRRSSSISMARVREIEFRDLDARVRSSQLKGLMYLHLKKGLEADPIDWVGSLDRFDLSADAKPVEARGPLTPHGVPKDVQARLAAVRTDLDSFTDAEARALMYSGYRMAAVKLQEALPTITLPSAPAVVDWGFLQIEKTLTKAKDHEEGYDDLIRMLTVARSTAWKVWRLRGVHWILPALLLAAFVVNYELGSSGIGDILTGIGGILALLFYVVILGGEVTVPAALLFLVLCGILRLAGWRRPVARVSAGLFMTTVGWIPWAVHQHLIDPLFLLRGSDPSTPLSTKLIRTWRPIAASIVALVLIVTPFVGRARSRTDLRAQAFEALRNKQWQQAVVAWDRVIESAPTDLQARLGRAWANRELHQYPQAIADYGKVLDSQPRNLDALLGRAWSSAQNRQYPQAIADYGKALDVDPNNLGALFGRAWGYAETQQYPQAIADYSKVLETSPDNIDALMQRAWWYRETRRYNDAIEDYTHVFRLNKSPDALRERAFTYRRAGNLKAAEADDYAWRQATQRPAPPSSEPSPSGARAPTKK
jgi:predicted acylesterase/phospholipase RssA/cellulose biosynthesis protein BcsQ/Flp pilus assembly protein TadD